MSTSSASATDRNNHEHRTDRRTTALAVASVLVPPAAWLLSLSGSYVLEDFVCTAVASAGRTPPEWGLWVLLIVLNTVLLLITLLAGITGWGALRRARRAARPALVRFLGGVGAVLSLVMAYGIVLIATQLLFLEVCG
jgi:hypothetical protein